MLVENIDQFLKNVPKGVLLALDLGTKYIGIAKSDFDQKISLPYETFQRTILEEDLKYLSDLTVKEKVVGIIIGLPRENDGRENKFAKKVRYFSKLLMKIISQIRNEDFFIFLHYEGFTSSMANKIMQGEKITDMIEKNDQVAAHILLMEFIEYKKNQLF